MTSSQLAALLPTDDEVRAYREDGYYISKKIFPDDIIDAAVMGSERFYSGEYELTGHREIDAYIEERKPGGDYGNRLRKNDYAHFFRPELRPIVRSSIIGAIAARLAGTPSIRLWHDQLLYKPPTPGEAGANIGWHTDRAYWQCCSSDNMLTAWIPFHDSDEEIGTITMIRGSHLWPDNTEALDFFSGDLEGLEKRFNTGGRQIVKVPMYLPKGHVSFHHCLTIHGSGPNRTTRPRRSIAVHLQDEANRSRHHRLGDGSLAGHYNNVIARKVGGLPDYTDPEGFPVLFSETG